MQETRQRGFFGRLLHNIFLIITGYLAFVGLIVTILSIGLGVLIYRQFGEGSSMGGMETLKKPAAIVDRSIIRIKLDRPLSMQSIDEGDRIWSQLFSNKLPIALDDLQQTLRRAAEDKRIKGVLLDVENTQADLTTVTALRRALEQFRGSQKPVFVYLNEGDSSLYYLASVANKVSLAPISGLTIPGPNLQLTYFGSALAKLGVQLEVVKAGRYKSAMEAFVQDAPSAETLEMYQSIESSLRSTLVEAVAAGRQKPVETVTGWFKHSLFTSQEALTQGLVDRLGYASDWEEELKQAADADAFVEFEKYLDGSDEIEKPRFATGDEAIGLIEAEGEIAMASSGSSSQITPERLIEQLRWAAEEEQVKAIVLRIDSPGGSALASDLIWDEVQKLALKKPLVVSMGSVAASGGYYIAAPAALIVAEPTTITGSIGVIGAIPKGLQVAEKWGVHFHTVTGSDRKSYLNFGTASTPEDKSILGNSIKYTYDAFVQKVAAGRKQAPEKIYEIAEGRVYTGSEALKLGLVDRLGGLREALQAAKELGKLDPEKLYSVLHYRPKAQSLIECLRENSKLWECVAESQGTHLGLGTLALPGLSSLQKLERMIKDDHVLAYWPGHVQWRQGRED